MPAPYPPPQQSAAAEGAKSALDAKSLLALAAAVLGLISWFLGFFGSASLAMSGMSGFAVIATAALAGMWVLPRVPSSLVAMVPLAVYAGLSMLQRVLLGLITDATWVSGGPVAVVLMLLVLLQTVSVVGLVLFEYRVLTPPAVGGAGPTQQVAHPGASGQQGAWNPQSGPYPAQPGAQQQGGWHPQSGGFVPGTPQGTAQPGQFGQPQPAQPHAQQQEHAQPGSFAQQPYQGGQQDPYSRQHPPEQQPVQGQWEQHRADPAGGPQGTQQMPYPGKQPPG